VWPPKIEILPNRTQSTLAKGTLVNIVLFPEIFGQQINSEIRRPATRAKKREIVLELYEPIKRGER